MKLHRLLKRQIKKSGSEIEGPRSLSMLIDYVDAAYKAYDKDLSSLERTLELSSEESFKELSDYKYAINQSSIVYITNNVGVIEHVNKHFEDISGYRLSELKGKDVRVIRTDLHNADFFHKIGEVLYRGDIWTGEVSNKAKDGKIFWLSTTIVPLKNEGVPMQYLSISYDITERVKADKKLKDSEEEYRNVVNSIPEIIFKTDKSGKFTFISNSWENIFGGKVIDALGRNFLEFISPKDRERALGNFASRVDSNEGHDDSINEYAANNIKGDTLLVEVRALESLDNKGKISGFSGTITDVTKFRESSAKIHELTKAMESAADGFAILDLDGKYEYMNNSYASQLGYSKEDIYGKKWEDLYSKSTKDLYDEEIRTSIEDKGYWVGESYGLCKNGTPVSQDLTVTLLENGKLVCNCKDNTGRKAQETKLLNYSKSLERKNDELDKFAYIVSHDLKAPLRAINNLSVWLEEDLESLMDQSMKDQFKLLRGRVHRMEGLIQGILEYSRIGRTTNKTDEVDVSFLLKEIKDSLGLEGENKLRFPSNLPVINTDRILLNQIFSNLISNGYKYNDKKSKLVEVKCTKEKDKYIFSVEDNGIGIEKEYTDKIFEIFQTLHARDKIESTGVGLAIVKKILDDRRQVISVESEVGKGSRITFTWQDSQQISINK